MSTPLNLSGLGLPRRNGELAFDAPWQSTVFALAAAVVENALGGDREPIPAPAHRGHRGRPRPPLLGKLDRRTRGTRANPAPTTHALTEPHQHRSQWVIITQIGPRRASPPIWRR